MSLQLGVSRSKAGRWISLADSLSLYPKVRAAFLAGDFDIHRVQTIVSALADVPSDVQTDDGVDIEDVMVELAGRPSTDTVLRDQLEALVISLDPDAAADRREEFADRCQDVTITSDVAGHATIDATVTAELGVHLREQIADLVDRRTCGKDSRPVGRRRVAALAELTGFSGARLTCECGIDHDAPAPAPESECVPAVEQPVAPVSAPAGSSIEVLVDPTGIELPRLRGYGAIDPALATDLSRAADRSPRVRVIGRRNVGPPGGGARGEPPPGALVYQPSALVRAEVLESDLTCRYPFCGMPAELCHLDHLEPFNHADPVNGGWSVPANLAPLCTPDHHRKHLGEWIPHMHPDRTITWHNPTTRQTITTHPR